MASRGLPGFLRRSTRRSDFSSDDEDVIEDEASEEISKEITPQEPAFPPVTQAKQQQGREDSWSGLADVMKPEPGATEDALETDGKQDQSDNVVEAHASAERSVAYGASSSSHPSDEINDTGSTTSSVGFDDSTVPNNNTTSRLERKQSYRETQFERIIKADVVQMSELRKLGWNGIPVRHDE